MYEDWLKIEDSQVEDVVEKFNMKVQERLLEVTKTGTTNGPGGSRRREIASTGKSIGIQYSRKRVGKIVTRVRESPHSS